jgi:diguanylate cyclase
MPGVVGWITQYHDPGLIALACLVCALAATTTARLLSPRETGQGPRRAIRLVAAVMAFGTGVWATQVISVLAYCPVAPSGFDVPLCLLSLALVIATTSLAFMVAPRPGNTVVSFVASGLILTIGIAATHVVGSHALLGPGVHHERPGLVAVALCGSALCAVAAVGRLTRRSPGMASVFLTLAVIFTDFIAIASITLERLDRFEVPPVGASRLVPAIAAAGVCLTILALALAAFVLEEHHGHRLARAARRFRTFADATFDGIVFERDGRVADVNRAMSRLAGSDAATLVGLRLADLMPGIELTPQSGEPPVEHDVLLPDGQTRPVEVAWRDDPEWGGHVVAIRDLSRLKAAEAQIERLARFDVLTGLANRDTFEEKLQHALALSGRGANSVALLHIGLDRFDNVYEALGPRAGEQILVQTAKRLSVLVRETDTVARLGRDQFAVIQCLIRQPSDAAALADRIVADLARPFSIDEQAIALNPDVGIALYPNDGKTTAELIRNAALARRYAKHDGHGWRCFEPSMDRVLQANRSLEHDLLIALREGQFCLHYQPFVAIQSQDLAGYEALLRWDHPERGRVSPADFIPLAETSGLIVPIGNWVLATACAEAMSWEDPVIISVNLSPAQFVEPGIVATVADVLRRTGLPAARLELEITEGTLMDDTQNALRILNALKALGVKISMDDFGTGYSSLSYLRKFPFDKIKIDRSFISDVGDDSEAETIVQAIIALGRSLRLDVTAEGVETRQQLSMLRGHGCTFAQGYLLGRPHPADQIGQHLNKDWPVFGDDPAVQLSASAAASPA